MPHTVRTHTRKTASGRTVTVRQHARAGGSGVQPSPRRRRCITRKQAAAVTVFAGAATLFAVVTGTSIILGVVGLACGVLSLLLSSPGPKKVRQAKGTDDWWDDDEPPARPVRPRQRTVPVRDDLLDHPMSGVRRGALKGGRDV